ncbi:MAG: energy-coupling factor ABC transporter permease [Pseudomonadota bacterium]
MDIPAGLLPGSYHFGAAVLYVLLLLLALLTAPWWKIRDSEAQQVHFGAIVIVLLLWIMHGGIQRGLDYHLLGATGLTLLFEWQFALFAVSMVLALTTWQGAAGWEAFGVNALVMGAVPITFTRMLLYLSQRWLPHNYFIYVFINAFLAGALSILLAGLVSGLVQQLAAVHPGDTLVDNFLVILPMLMFGEGFLNGAALSLVVAYRPAWVATFHDRWYLQGK